MEAEHARGTGIQRLGSSPSLGGPASGTHAASGRLGGARADFVAGLGRKVVDLRSSIARVRNHGPDGDAAARVELRRKLHALASAAKMMKFDAMERALAEALGTLDRADAAMNLETVDVDGVEQIVEDLPALAWGDGRAQSTRLDTAPRTSASVQYAVLVVGSPRIAEALLDEETISPRGVAFACESTPDAQAAYDIVRTTEPDLVILDADLDAAGVLVEALMDDPLTETVPVIVVGSFLEPGEAERFTAMGVAKTVTKPTSREALRATCEKVLAPERDSAGIHVMLGEPTLEELSERLAKEIKNALLGGVDPTSRMRRIPLGQGTEILGAMWGAIARVREVVTARSDGHIRFTGGPAGAHTPALLLECEADVPRSDRLRQRRSLADDVRLTGRRVVVADDDPGVVWFIADLLKTAGCVVHEAFDGQQALELAYETSPDLVISDILMPKIDGFSLCRALRRDVALRDTPVILLSWKEDLLQRVRELGAGAAGYVRKESDTRAIIARVREALRSRGRVEARLREDGEVRGRLDGISIKTLLEIVCATRPEARVSVRDASFLYEVEIRWGAPHRATRTDGDGGFHRGSKVLAQLLGVSAGRFTVATSTTDIEAELDGNLAAQLAKPIARARAAMTILAGGDLHAVSRIRLDEELLDDYLKATPERLRILARRLANGASPREVVTFGGFEPALLDDLLSDLAARGIVTGIEDMNGRDMLAAAFGYASAHPDARAALAPRTETPDPFAIVEANACVNDEASALCDSPDPGNASSLEDAVMREVIHRSPSPVGAAALPRVEVALVDPHSLRLRQSPMPPIVDEVLVTPPADQVAALGEPTVIDDTLYGDGELHDPESLEASVPPLADFTPFGVVTSDEPPAAAPTTGASKKRWPMVAFVAATGAVAWAVLHYAAGPVKPSLNQHEAPAEEMVLPARPEAPSPTHVVKLTAPDVATATATATVAAASAKTRPTSMPSSTSKVSAANDERDCASDPHASRVVYANL